MPINIEKRLSSYCHQRNGARMEKEITWYSVTDYVSRAVSMKHTNQLAHFCTFEHGPMVCITFMSVVAEISN